MSNVEITNYQCCAGIRNVIKPLVSSELGNQHNQGFEKNQRTGFGINHSCKKIRQITLYKLSILFHFFREIRWSFKSYEAFYSAEQFRQKEKNQNKKGMFCHSIPIYL